MMTKVPVTVVTGFLGSGKTTLIRHLLQNNEGRRIAVVVNEFGEVGIDGELLRSCGVCEAETSDTPPPIVELTNGCLCCTVQEEFLPTMQQLLRRKDQIDCILIETSGLALPKPLVQAFRWPQVRTQTTVDGVITVVDGEALAAGRLVSNLEALQAQRQADDSLEHETPIEELFADQLACADMVLVTKMDQVPPNDRDRLQQWLQAQVPAGVKVIPCHRGQIHPAIILGLNAAVENHIDQRPSHHDYEEVHEHDDHMRALSLEVPHAFHPAALVQRLQALVQQQNIYRIKGFVAVPGKPMRLVLQGVGQRFEHFYDRPWRSDEPRQTRLVVIGQNLDAATIHAELSPIALPHP